MSVETPTFVLQSNQTKTTMKQVTRKELVSLLPAKADTPIMRKWLRRVYSKANRVCYAQSPTFTYDDHNTSELNPPRIIISWKLIENVYMIHYMSMPVKPLDDPNFDLNFDSAQIHFRLTGYTYFSNVNLKYYPIQAIAFGNDQAHEVYIRSKDALIAHIVQNKIRECTYLGNANTLFNKYRENQKYFKPLPFGEVGSVACYLCVQPVLWFNKGMIVDMYYQSFSCKTYRNDPNKLFDSRYPMFSALSCDLSRTTQDKLLKALQAIDHYPDDAKIYYRRVYNTCIKYMKELGID